MDILIVDDAPVSIKILDSMLKKLGFDVLIAHDGLEALELYNKHDIRIVITDWMMPNMDGLTLCEEIRKTNKNIYTYIIIVTTKDQKEDINEAFEKGADDFISKPIDINRFKASLKAAHRITSLSEDLNSQIEKNEETLVRLNSILEYSSDLIYTLDLDGTFIETNEITKELTGYSKKELINTNFFNLVPEKNRKEIKNVFNSIAESGKALRNYQFNVLTKDGKEKYFETSSGIVQNIKGISGFQGSLKDITERVEALKALEESEKQNRLLIESMQEGLIRLDRNGILSFVNDSFCEICGYSKDELIGKKIHFLLTYEEKEKIKERIARRREGISESYELNFINKEGKFIPVIISAKPILNTEGQFDGTVVVVTDITSIKKAEHERKLIETQLLQADKMASIGQLAAGVAHEINNPTGFVSSNINTLSDYISKYKTLINEYRNFINELKQNDNTNQINNIQKIKDLEDSIDIDFLMDDVTNLIQESSEGTNRIKKIIQDLKDFAHPGEDTPTYADINKCIESTLNIVWNEIKYKAKVVKEYDNLPEVLCYPQQLNQVFANILVNAGQAIKDEGEIRIKTSLSNDKIEVVISDTGIGISQENLSRVFDPFFTTKEVGKGTGLGLNVAYNILKKHHGEIKINSKEGDGTSFFINIPINNTDESLKSG